MGPYSTLRHTQHTTLFAPLSSAREEGILYRTLCFSPGTHGTSATHPGPASGGWVYTCRTGEFHFPFKPLGTSFPYLEAFLGGFSERFPLKLFIRWLSVRSTIRVLHPYVACVLS